MGAEPRRRMTEHRIPDLELGDIRADGFYVTGELDTERSPSRPAEPGHQSPQEGICGANVRVGLRNRARSDPDEHLVVLRYRPVDFLDPEHLGGPVPVLNDGFHPFTMPRSGPGSAAGAQRRRRVGRLFLSEKAAEAGADVPPRYGTGVGCPGDEPLPRPASPGRVGRHDLQAERLIGPFLIKRRWKGRD